VLKGLGIGIVLMLSSRRNGIKYLSLKKRRRRPMRDKVGDYHNDLDSVFQRLLIIDERIRIIMERINWLENPETAPKSKQPKPKEEENL
tara:strand:+ start:4125 stop:4391 length:267 start_codon:yes stop_codon:yes gene_type:complete